MKQSKYKVVAPNIIDFLKKDYPDYFKVQSKSECRIKKEQTIKKRFEIRDSQDQILQDDDKGVSIIRNQQDCRFIEIIDFEDYIDQYTRPDAGKGMRCDFIIHIINNDDIIVFNELSESKKKYAFPNPSGKESKLETAIKQLNESIKKFYTVNDFLDRYKKKVGLFSLRLTDINKGKSKIKSIRKKFRKPMSVYKNSSGRDKLDHGFIFEMRI